MSQPARRIQNLLPKGNGESSNSEQTKQGTKQRERMLVLRRAPVPRPSRYASAPILQRSQAPTPNQVFKPQCQGEEEEDEDEEEERNWYLMAAAMRFRSSSPLPILLLSSLNLLLLVLASASFAPVFLLRTCPTSFGWALFAVSSSTAISSLVGFFSQLTHLCFVAHVALVLASSLGQALGFLALFLRPGPSLQLLGSTRSERERRALVRVEEALLLGMFLLQSLVLVSSCALQRWWVRQLEGVEAEKEAMARKRGRRMARVQEEAIAEAKARELDEKTRSQKGQWVKNDFEGL